MPTSRPEIRYPPNIAKALHGQTLYANLEVLPNLMLEIGPEPGSPEYEDWQGMINAGLKEPPRILPVKNVPPHHAQVYLADQGDIAEIFGDPARSGNFIIGYTREQNHPVCIDLEKFVQRSSGVFGATGTGKSFLTRARAGRADPLQQGLRAGARHAQRVRLRRCGLRHEAARHRA